MREKNNRKKEMEEQRKNQNLKMNQQKPKKGH